MIEYRYAYDPDTGDANNRLPVITGALGHITRIEYEAAGNPAKSKGAPTTPWGA